ncbi:tail fiber domain-containing protein [Acinetobacter sp.]|uniref:tail fiber domain-containing protein n=1 Tax=Acinetobacter sp. TaxID=472 RepID=UPI00388E9DDC
MLIDNPQIVEGSSIGNPTLASGTTFPSLPSSGELFFRTDTLSLNFYNGTEWVDVKSLSSGLNAFANLSENGFVVKTADGGVSARILANGNGITITNGNGINGNPLIALASSGVAPGSYGSANTSPTFTIDTTGRIVAAAQNAIQPLWANIQNKPTSISGYGITDAVSLGNMPGAPLATSAAPGTATTAAKADHVHPLPTIDNLSTGITGKAIGDVLSWTDTGWKNVTQTSIAAGSAVQLSAPRTLAISGDGSGSATFNGASNATIPLILQSTGVSAGTYGSSTSAPIITVDQKGRLTSASSTTITPAWTSITGKPTTLAGYGITDATSTSGAGTPNGFATLDSTGKLSTSQIPPSLVGALQFQGTWDAASNNPPLVSSTGTKGQFYKVSVAGATSINGQAYWQVGDLIIFDGVTWDRIEGGPTEVSSVAGRVGNVTLSVSDVNGAVSTNGSGATGTWNINISGSAPVLTGPAHVNGSDGWFRSSQNAGWYNETYNVGIYATEAGNVRTYNGANLIVGGYVLAGGDVSAYSDERLKENWRDVNVDFIDKWAHVKSGTYDRIDTGLTQIGVSAQSVQQILPAAVTEHSDGYLSLNYGAASMVATVQLAKELVELREIVKKQDTIIKYLMEKVGK